MMLWGRSHPCARVGLASRKASDKGETDHDAKSGGTAGKAQRKNRPAAPQAGQADRGGRRRRHRVAVDVSILARGGQDHQDRHDHAGDRTDRRLRRAVEVGCRGRQQGFGRRHHGRRREAPGPNSQPGQPIESEPRLGSGGAAHQQRQGRHHDRLVDVRHDQSGGRPVRARRRALHHLGRSVAGLVLRPQGRSEEGLRVDLPLLLGLRHGRQHVRRDVADATDQQDRRRHADQRSRRHRRQRPGARAAGHHQEPRLRRALSSAFIRRCPTTSRRRSPS